MADAKNYCGSSTLLLITIFLVLHVTPAAAFGAGNIASISKIEGHNWRHGDIEDMLKTIAFIKGHKWTSMMVRRVYFGNWLRDYSQALDVGTLKNIQSGTIRILVWVLSFLSFGYATGEFEVTEERLGVYRPEEHIDNPKDYADNVDARQFDQRLRPPIQPIELQVDPETGMKNYIANERLGIATSAGYIKFSFTRSIHFGRLYTSGANGTNGREPDLCEALRCLGQGLHCLEDFGAHTNYTELALREQGYRGVFSHTGSSTEINLRGHRVFPLVTGTFGVVDFLHSVLGEATDHFAQTEVEQMNRVLADAQTQSKPTDGKRGIGDSPVIALTGLLSQVPGSGGLCQQAEYLQAQSDAQQQSLASHRGAPSEDPSAYRAHNVNTNFSAPPGTVGGPPGPGVPGMSPDFDPAKTASQIYPILEFRDKVVRAISATIEKIPGLEALVEKITETLTIFVLSLLAPFIRPIINAVSAQLKNGSTSVVDASGKHQYEPWTDPHCSNPTHSLLSKDHFSNILNDPAGQVASTILQYVAPRIIYAWQNPDVPIEQVLNDVNRVFHHPALRDPHCELHRNMYDVVQRWASSYQGPNLNDILGSDSVRKGKNHIGGDEEHGHGGIGSSNLFAGSGSHSKVSGAPWEKLYKLKNTTGIGRDDVGGPGDIPGAFPGTDTVFDSTRPPTGPQASYTGSQEQPPYRQEPYSSYPANSQQGPGYGAGPAPSTPSWNQGYVAPDDLYPPPSQQGGAYPPQHQGAYPPQGGYPSQPQQGYEYGAASPQPQGYGYDQNAPSSQPPHHQQQGYYNSPSQPPGPRYY